MEDTICLTSKDKTNRNSPRLLIFFITGNPGLIEYYRSFLTNLHESLLSQQLDLYHCLYGASLAGFEINKGSMSAESERRSRRPLNLRQTIDDVWARLTLMTRRLANYDKPVGADKLPDTAVKVVLIGHSVGAYILMELLERWRTSTGQQGDDAVMEVVGGICLFPTVVDLAKSPSGVKANWILTQPGFALTVHTLGRLLLFWWPLDFLTPLVQRITGFNREGARTTAAFIKSKLGVYQALYLTKYELQEITGDRWTDELWGVAPIVNSGTDGKASVVQKTAKLFFYYGEDDHWIANTTRDQLISIRASVGKKADESKPIVEIDHNGVPHSFCIYHSKLIADKVLEYILSIPGLPGIG